MLRQFHLAEDNASMTTKDVHVFCLLSESVEDVWVKPNPIGKI